MNVRRRESDPLRESTSKNGKGRTPVEVPVTMHWLWSPLGLLLILPAPALVGSLLLPPDSYVSLFGQPQFLASGHRTIAIFYFGLMVSVAAFGVPMSKDSRSAVRLDVAAQQWLDRMVRVLTGITITAYLAWLLIALARGLNSAVVVGLLRGDPGTMYELRNEYFLPVGGITTWTQVAAVAAPLAVLRSRAGIRRARVVLFWLVSLAFARALLNSERLALLEVVVSAGLAFAILRPQAPSLLRHVPVALSIFVAMWAGLFGLFAGFEFFRSWNTQGADSHLGFWAYAGTLLLGYYATALNLGAFDSTLLQGQTWPGYLFDGDIYGTFLGAPPTAGAQQWYGLETFTNRSGLLTPANAFGVVGGAVLVIGVSATLVILARAARSGGLAGFTGYCAFGIGLLEVVRIFYFGSSRILPVALMLGAVAASWFLSSRKGVSRSSSYV